MPPPDPLAPPAQLAAADQARWGNVVTSAFPTVNGYVITPKARKLLQAIDKAETVAELNELESKLADEVQAKPWDWPVSEVLRGSDAT